MDPSASESLSTEDMRERDSSAQMLNAQQPHDVESAEFSAQDEARTVSKLVCVSNMINLSSGQKQQPTQLKVFVQDENGPSLKSV